jgi:TonB family protein
MTAAAISFREPVLAWAISPEDEARFRRILRSVLAASAVVCLVLLLMPRPVVDRAATRELPPRLARLILEREPPKPVMPPSARKAPEHVAKAEIPEAAERPEVVKPQPAKPEPDAKEPRAPVPEARQPVPGKPPGEATQAARRKAAGVGLLAMKDSLAELRGAPLAVQLKQDIKPGPGVGTGVGVGVGAGTDPGIPTRALITSNATDGSGGINTAAYSRDTGGGGLAGRATTLVEGVAGGGGGGGPGGGGRHGAKGNGSGDGIGGSGKGGTLAKSGGGKASRSIEEIKLVFERNKGAIYAIYNRALREDPTLQGKVVVELKIAPTGEVSACRVVSSELRASELESKLLARIRQFDFGAKDVELMVVTWPVDFLPS